MYSNDDAKEEVKVITAEMAGIAEAAAAEARHLAINATPEPAPGRAGRVGKAAALVAERERTAEAVERIAAQTRVRLAGVVPDGSTRVVSLHDPDARPIAKGRLAAPLSSVTKRRTGGCRGSSPGTVVPGRSLRSVGACRIRRIPTKWV